MGVKFLKPPAGSSSENTGSKHEKVLTTITPVSVTIVTFAWGVVNS